MRRIGLYGGTFNPPHMGHVHVAQTVREALALDQLLLIPDRTPPHKQLPPDTPEEKHRLEMVRIMAESIPGAACCDLEMRMPPPSYTARTAEAMARQYPDAILWWIVGTDMLLTLRRWYHPEIIFRYCRIAVLARQQDDRAALRQEAAALEKDFRAGIDLVDAPVHPISSTQLREKLLAGERELSELPPGVEAYIRREGLYRG